MPAQHYVLNAVDGKLYRCPPRADEHTYVTGADYARLLEAARSCYIGLSNGKGSIPFMITMLRAAIGDAAPGE